MNKKLTKRDLLNEIGETNIKYSHITWRDITRTFENKLTDILVEKYKNHLDWGVISGTWERNENFLKKFKKEIIWQSIRFRNYKFSIDFLLEMQNYIPDIFELFSGQNIPVQIVEKFYDKFIWTVNFSGLDGKFSKNFLVNDFHKNMKIVLHFSRFLTEEDISYINVSILTDVFIYGNFSKKVIINHIKYINLNKIIKEKCLDITPNDLHFVEEKDILAQVLIGLSNQ